MAKQSNDGSGGDGSSNSSGSWQDRIRDAVQNSGDSGAANGNDGGNDDDLNGDGAGGKAPEAGNDGSGDDGAGDGAGDGNNGGDDGSGNGDGNGDDGAAGDGSGNGSGDGQGSEVRFSQFKGDGSQESYVKNLENGYLESSQEGIKQRDRADGLERQVNAIKEAANKDPEFGKKLLGYLQQGNGQQGGDGGSGDDGAGGNDVTQSSKNPFLVDAETTWNAKSEESAKEFADANPEVMTDPKINKEVKRWMRVFSNEVYESEGRLMMAGEAMAKAYAYLGYENKLKSDKTQNLVDGMKQNAAPTRPQAPKKKPTSNGGGNSKQFSDLTLNLADKMGISKERLEKGSKR